MLKKLQRRRNKKRQSKSMDSVADQQQIEETTKKERRFRGETDEHQLTLSRRRSLHLSSQEIHQLLSQPKLEQLSLAGEDDDDEAKERHYRERASQMRIQTLQTGKRWKAPLYSYEQLPTYLQDNEYIRSGYRAYYTWNETWASIFRIHNETGNIWTHLLGVVMVFGLAVHTLHSLPSSVPMGDVLAMLGFFSCSAACFAASTLFHTHFCQSRWAFVKFGCLDYAGISTMIAGSCSIVTYFAFYCNPFARNAWIGITVLLASVGIIGPWYEKWTHRSFRAIRATIYFVSAVTSALPVFQYLIMSGLPDDLDFEVYFGIFAMAILYTGGAMIYSWRVPERWFPGRCDIVGHSHQWWHLCVVAACWAHYTSAIRLLDWRLSRATCDSF